MNEVLMEAQMPSGWTQIGPTLRETDPPGSISHDGPGGRRVLMFGFYKDSPGVWESVAGVDLETPVLRAISSLGLEQLSDLSEPYELEVIQKGLRKSLRFSLRTAR